MRMCQSETEERIGEEITPGQSKRCPGVELTLRVQLSNITWRGATAAPD